MHLPAMDLPVVDSTGCGDAYCAGFITGLSLGWDLWRAAQLGNAAAALVLTGLGSDAGIIDLDHTVAFMERVLEAGTSLVPTKSQAESHGGSSNPSGGIP
jgi:sugar/nucleoside kinase (ribokinase family)